MYTCISLALGVGILAAGAAVAADTADPIDPLLRTVDLNVDEQKDVRLCDGSIARVKLLDVQEKRDPLRNAVRTAQVTVEVNGKTTTLPAANYHLPRMVGSVQIDCAVTRGYLKASNKRNVWALEGEARLRLWPTGSPWVRPGTMTCPVRQRWFASDTQMANDPCYVNACDTPSRKSIYYHFDLDFGGAEGLTDVLAATDGLVVSLGKKRLKEDSTDAPVNPRGDVVYIRDARGWYYRYSHLKSFDKSVRLGTRVKMGQRIGALGKEGGSGGWAHLHFGVYARQPNGKYGSLEAYALAWQAYHRQHGTELQAVARPHRVAWVGKEVVLSGERSWSVKGADHIAAYEWTFTNGTTGKGRTVKRTYDRPGAYSEILTVRDADGRTSRDFAVVHVFDPKSPKATPPAIHAAYHPTQGIQPGDELTFKVRSFGIAPTDGRETWDFGDASPSVKTQSDGNAKTHAPDGYAATTHRYTKPGDYLVTVSRTNRRGETAVTQLQVRVEP